MSLRPSCQYITSFFADLIVRKWAWLFPEIVTTLKFPYSHDFRHSVDMVDPFQQQTFSVLKLVWVLITLQD